MTLDEIAVGWHSIDGLRLLVNVTTKAIVVLPVTALIVCCLMRRASSASRHLVWLLAIGIVMGAPIFSPCIPFAPMFEIGSSRLNREPAESPVAEPTVAGLSPHRQELEVDTTPPDAPYRQELLSRAFADQRSVMHVHSTDPDTTTKNATAQDRTGDAIPLSPVASSDAKPTARDVRSWARPAVVVWTSGVFALLSLLAAGQIRGIFRRRAYSVVHEGRLPRMCRTVGADIGLRREVSVYVSDQDAIPMTWGVVRPRLMLPASARTWSDERLRMVLLHELAHVKRLDCLWQIVSALTIALHWFNPLVWMAAIRLRIECEQACDDVVLSSGVSGPDYAEQLLDISTGGRRGVLALCAGLAMARSHRLAGRLRAIIDTGRNRRPVSHGVLASFTTGAIVLAVPVTLLTNVTFADRTVEATEAQKQASSNSTGEKPAGPSRHSVVLSDGSLISLLQSHQSFVDAAVRLAESASVEVDEPPVSIPEPNVTLVLNPGIPVRRGGPTATELTARKIIVGTDNPLGPDRVILRVDNTLHAFAKYHLADWVGFRAELARLQYQHIGTVVESTGEWSEPVDGLSARMSVEDWRHPMIGVNLELKNTTDATDAMVIPFDADRLVFTLHDAHGKERRKFPGPFGGPVEAIGNLTLPPGSSTRLNLSVPTIATPHAPGAMVVLRHHVWLIRNEREHRLSAMIRVDESDNRQAWHGTIDVPAVSVRYAGRPSVPDRTIRRRHRVAEETGEALARALAGIFPKRIRMRFTIDDATSEIVVRGPESQHEFVQQLVGALEAGGHARAISRNLKPRPAPELLRRVVEKTVGSGPFRFRMEGWTTIAGVTSHLADNECLAHPAGIIRRSYDGMIDINDYHNGRRLLLEPSMKRAGVDTTIPSPSGGHFFDDVRKAALAPEHEVRLLGSRVIGDGEATGYSVAIDDTLLAIWGDEQTAEPVLIETSQRHTGFDSKFAMSQFDFSVDVDDSLFSTNPPGDYAVTIVHNHSHAGEAAEMHLLHMLNMVTRWSNGGYPAKFTPLRFIQPASEKIGLSQQAMPPERLVEQGMEASVFVDMGFKFVRQLPREAEPHYCGAGLTRDGDRQVLFYYRPQQEGSTGWRVIYSDMSVARQSNRPQPSNAVSVYDGGRIQALSPVVPVLAVPAEQASVGSASGNQPREANAEVTQNQERGQVAKPASGLSVAIDYFMEATVGPGVVPDEDSFAFVEITNHGKQSVSAPETWWSMQAIVDGTAHEMLPENTYDWNGAAAIIAGGRFRSVVSLEEFGIFRELLKPGGHTFQIRVGDATSNTLTLLAGPPRPAASAATQQMLRREVRLSSEFRNELQRMIATIPWQTRAERREQAFLESVLTGPDVVTMETMFHLLAIPDSRSEPFARVAAGHEDVVVRFSGLWNLATILQDRDAAVALTQLGQDDDLSIVDRQALNECFRATQLAPILDDPDRVFDFLSRESRHESLRPQPGARVNDVVLQTMSGDTIRLAELKGKPVLLHFWTSACPPCVAEFPTLQKDVRRWMAMHPDLVVVSINLDEDVDAAKAQFGKYPLDGRNVWLKDGLHSPIAREFLVYSYPTDVVIGRDGRIAGYWRNVIASLPEATPRTPNAATHPVSTGRSQRPIQRRN